MSKAEPVRIDTGSAPLNGHLTIPDGPLHRVVLLNGATGIPHGYYRYFAQWLARERGAATLSYDYRDFGASATGPMRHATATMADWGIHDQQTARDWLSARFPDRPLWVIGHSLGGFMLPWQRGLERIDRLIAVASGPVHYRDHPWPYQALARSFWFGHGPVIDRLLGYLPARMSGLGADLPSGVYRQWRRWCIDPAFAEGVLDAPTPVPDFHALTCPARLVSFSDDPLIPPANVQKLAGFYPAADLHHDTLAPQDHGLDKIGHLACFARRNETLWPVIVPDVQHQSGSRRI